MQTNSSGFAFSQLARALRAAEINLTNPSVSPQAVQKAHKRAAEWVKIIEVSGSLLYKRIKSDPDQQQHRSHEFPFTLNQNSATYNFGSRTPVPSIPAWVTLKVAHGGFATGELLAEGELQPHEIQLLAKLPANPASDRARLNAFFMSEQGMLQLHQLLQTSCYRINVPEEGALLSVAYLLAHDRVAEAEAVVASISGFFPRLRFYPCPADAPMPLSSVVCLTTVGEVQSALQLLRTKLPVQTLKAVLRHLRPLQDEFEALYLETLPVGAAIPMATRDQHKRTVSVDGALPCQVWPAGWHDRAKVILDGFASATQRFGEPSRKHKSLLLLVKLTRKLCSGQTLSDGEIRRIRWLLAESNACRGLPGSTRLAALRQAQERSIEHHCVEEQAQLILSRLQQIKNKADGIDDVSEILRPANTAEALKFRIPENYALGPTIQHLVQRARKDDMYRLIEAGLVPSAEVLALLVPQVVAQARATSLGDESRKQLYGQIYKAFSSRRSLLLLNLQHQVRITELPWVKALESEPNAHTADANKAVARTANHEALSQLSMAAVEAFPVTILPNKLLKELTQLANAAGLSDKLPLVEELAVDIFMHAFTKKFVRALEHTATLLANTPYVAYYGIDCNALRDLVRRSSENDFYQLCCTRAGFNRAANFRYGSPAQNGTVVEQQQILTTHNLATLFRELGLADRIAGRLPSLPRKCITFIVQQLASLHNYPWRTQLQTIKNCAYAWRQMMFFVSLLSPEDQQAFFSEANQQVECMKDQEMRDRFRTVMEGFGEALHGNAPRVVFLGWTTSRHFLLPPQLNVKD